MNAKLDKCRKKKKKTMAYHDLADIDGFWGHKHES